jgi:beta-glucosidase
VVIAVVGITAQLEGEESESSDPGFSGGDRTDITLPSTQQELLEAVAATGKPLVVVLTSGSAMAINWADEHAAAILQAWYPGEEGGTAVADILSGESNPAGRLPVTFYKSVAQLPPFTDYNMAGRTYRYFTEPPLYPFGFGLSYSTFSYSDISITDFAPNEGSDLQKRSASTPADSSSVQEVSGSAPVYVSSKVTNTSKLAGDEVAELYISHAGVDGAPIRSLVGFKRIHLEPGTTQFVSFVLGPRELSIVDSTGHRLVPTGPVEVWLGSTQPITLPNHPAPNGRAAKFTITSSTSLAN